MASLDQQEPYLSVHNELRAAIEKLSTICNDDDGLVTGYVVMMKTMKFGPDGDTLYSDSFTVSRDLDLTAAIGLTRATQMRLENHLQLDIPHHHHHPDEIIDYEAGDE